ncbi:hypothetical protein CK503_14960 [Aliifodinibius salipaludis]|uniref:DUF4625 domain-containing protein n=1 Tax=Fodinibius salipaludis TaxID=2032627 RepID=A0A2A2G659_9BACT|nr:hypothetical protein [Aliifodinibius salipaludis]PAU92788.1 hypothetical protein CK503_14960 [Aliifodinibius salipaludis]
MNIYTNFSTKLIAITFSAVLLFAGCSNPASNDDHEEHSEPHSIEFVTDGKTIVTYGSEVSGHFDVEEQDDTSLITAKFFDEDGNEIHGDDLDDEYSLAWEIADTDHADIEQHDDDGRWSFHIAGKAAGETVVQFLLQHGDDHADFYTPAINESNAIKIHVEESSN